MILVEPEPKVAGVPGVTEALFIARQSALAQEQSKLSQTPMLYSCELCGKAYRSSKAHAQHLTSRSHIMRTSEGSDGPHSVGATVIKPFRSRVGNKEHAPLKEVEEEESEDSEDEWEEVDPDEDLIDEATDSITNLNVDEHGSDDEMDANEVVDPCCCFMCDSRHRTVEKSIVHMHKQHGFFIPDIEYLKDAEGLLTYLGLKVKRDFMCLYCNERCHPFNSLEAVRKHMEAKSHCKVRYGDGGDDEEAELEEFYDYSSSYVDADGKQLVTSDDQTNTVELGSGGSELVITRKEDSGTFIRTLGSREYLRYYRQKPRPSQTRDVALAAVLSARYKSMGLTTVQSRDQIVRLKVLREMNRSGVEAMRSKMGMKSNVIRNLPKNCTY
ncbi:Cytoplasmic 60s subunit biogenesis factor rei1-like protein [Thalictrum thalictroides]|uniref:Cytoplasmic 60s subunit biogenesis factor rei1-like protein n=1 Tax=Thalictrum thalictroides TaxID=46969 RepID=A0A7J6WNM5_THATH|nr:Cytoplasmic 60s subunit biogenesis factor rei1-like protein [Thalictrum thalictroides]